jgi:hypothetical protein
MFCISLWVLPEEENSHLRWMVLNPAGGRTMKKEAAIKKGTERGQEESHNRPSLFMAWMYVAIL